MSSYSLHLICLPYQSLTLSSLSTALLSTFCKQQGVASAESYLHFPFADLVGRESYARIALDDAEQGFAGELLFAEDYHGELPDLGAVRLLGETFGPRERRRQIMEDFRRLCLRRVEEVGAPLVGFTTSSSQLLASVWLARQIKHSWPEVRVVLGGANCSMPMGAQVKESYPEIDYVVSGWGEQPLHALASGRHDGRALILNESAINLDSLPCPDYGPFLEQARAYVPDPTRLMLAFESSRGCWWGQKSHCTFCGLNQLEMAFNEKSSETVVREIRTLWERHGVNLFATDTILSRRHLKEVMPELARYERGPKIFYELKANMTNDEVRLLRRANVRWVQPGIESLSTPLLRLLRKGVSAIQNIALLKWCREEGILVSWNLLCGIPGEDPDAYEDQLRLMELIPHFAPPQGVTPIRIDRYSPYFNSYATHGWSGIHPYDGYGKLHPHLDEEALRAIAYHFEPEGGVLAVDGYLDRLRDATETWRRRHSSGEGLFYDPAVGLFRVRRGEAMLLQLDEASARVVASAHEITGLTELLGMPGVTQGVVDGLVEGGILYREQNRFVTLVARVPQG